MANYTLTGTLGAGKSVIAISRLVKMMLNGLPTAGNLDFYPEKALPAFNKSIYLRLPDFPTATDFWLLGSATESKLEKYFGGLFLDELAVFLNSRQWASKGREEFISYLRHVRKKHWHTFFLTQDIESLDKQVRMALVEHKAVCSRTDRLPIPIIGGLLKIIGVTAMLPKVHMAIIRYGTSPNARKVDTWVYTGKSLHDAYNTDQIFTDEENRALPSVFVPEYYFHNRPFNTPVISKKEELREVVPTSSGSYSCLSAWHLKGRYLSPIQRIKPYLLVFGFLFVIFYAIFFYFLAPKPQLKELGFQTVQQTVLTPQAEIFGSKVKSYYTSGYYHYLQLEDGQFVESDNLKNIDENTIMFKVGDLWHVYYK